MALCSAWLDASLPCGNSAEENALTEIFVRFQHLEVAFVQLSVIPWYHHCHRTTSSFLRKYGAQISHGDLLICAFVEDMLGSSLR